MQTFRCTVGVRLLYFMKLFFLLTAKTLTRAGAFHHISFALSLDLLRTDSPSLPCGQALYSLCQLYLFFASLVLTYRSRFSCDFASHKYRFHVCTGSFSQLSKIIHAKCCGHPHALKLLAETKFYRIYWQTLNLRGHSH